jgi:hypothetical protein
VGNVAVRLAPCLGPEACMRGYLIYRVPIVAPGPTSGEDANPLVGSTYLFPRTSFLFFFWAAEEVVGGPPWEVPQLEIRERPPSMLENVDGRTPRRCWSWRSGSAHHQRYKCRWRAPWEVAPELEIWEHPPSTLENIDGGPPGRQWWSWRSDTAHHQH